MMIGPLRTAFDLALRSSRVPLDLTLLVSGRADTIHEVRLDRAEAGLRSVLGALLGDEELSGQGARGLAIADRRERVARAGGRAG